MWYEVTPGKCYLGGYISKNTFDLVVKVWSPSLPVHYPPVCGLLHLVSAGNDASWRLRSGLGPWD